MGDTLITIVAIFLAATLMFVFPLSAISEMNDKEALAMVQSYTTEFVDNARASGQITEDDYNSFVQKLHATGNTYDIEIEVQRADTNPGKKKASIQLVGETKRYSEFTSQITSNFPCKLKQGDYIIVYVKNNNTTISQMIKGALYSVTGDQSYVISAQASGAVIGNGS